jgi:hypothetical protein
LLVVVLVERVMVLVVVLEDLEQAQVQFSLAQQLP